jgi:sterol 3beta-glucosyltransferase
MAGYEHRLDRDMRRDVLAACEDAEGIVAHPMMDNRALCVAEKRDVPVMIASMFPLRRTADFPCAALPVSRLPFRFLNLLTHDLMYSFVWKQYRDDINGWRRELGLPALPRSARERFARPRTPVMNAFSRHVVPEPRDWGSDLPLTGFWHAPQPLKTRLDGDPRASDLGAWLDAGPPPVFLGFGSMATVDPAAIVGTAVALSRKLGARVVVGAGWSDASAMHERRPPPEVRVVDAVDHDWLFPRCRVVVHHGGAGTTAAGLRAGVPTVICPVFAEQPFWGARVAALGVGFRVPLRDLHRPRFEAALRRALDDTALRARAARLGESLRAEDGLGAAASFVEGRLPTAHVAA